MDEVIISRIEVRSKILLTVFFKFSKGLCRKFDSDEEVQRYIDNNIEEAFCEAIEMNDDGYYILNICSIDYFVNHGFGEEIPKELLERQLHIYYPLIQKFITDASTRTLTI